MRSKRIKDRCTKMQLSNSPFVASFSCIHEFGMIIRQTLTLQSEFGNSARYTMVSVNGELIFINVLTNALLDIGLPVINEKPQ